MTIKFSIKGDKLILKSPFHANFPAKARAIGGDFNWDNRTWTFAARDEERVRQLLKDVYGYTGEQQGGPSATIHVVIGPNTDNPLWLAGRKVAHRQNRDWRVNLSDGVILIKGELPASGGSSKYPRLVNRGGSAVLEVRDVPLAMARELAAGHDDITIVSSETGDAPVSITVELPGAVVTILEDLEANLPGLDRAEVVGTAISFYAIQVRQYLDEVVGWEDIKDKVLSKAIHTPEAWNDQGWLSRDWVQETYGYALARCTNKFVAILYYGLGLKTKDDQLEWIREQYREYSYFQIAKNLSKRFVPISATSTYRSCRVLGFRGHSRGRRRRVLNCVSPLSEVEGREHG